MTSENDFQRALDANPDDWQTRLVFADWLQDRNDPRTEGYRALGMLKRWPAIHNTHTAWGGTDHPYYGEGQPETVQKKEHQHLLLPADWFHTIPFREGDWASGNHEIWKFYDSRRKAEDAAALAFTKLLSERQVQLLAGSAVTA